MGLPPSGDMSEIEMTNLASWRQTIIGTKMGMAQIRQDIPEIISLYREGKWVLDELISGRFDFVQINDAIAAAQQAENVRIIVTMR